MYEPDDEARQLAWERAERQGARETGRAVFSARDGVAVTRAHDPTSILDDDQADAELVERYGGQDWGDDLYSVLLMTIDFSNPDPAPAMVWFSTNRDPGPPVWFSTNPDPGPLTVWKPVGGTVWFTYDWSDIDRMAAAGGVRPRACTDGRVVGRGDGHLDSHAERRRRRDERSHRAGRRFVVAAL